MKLKFLAAFAVLAGLGLSLVSSVFAINLPNFPSCVSPTGTLKVSYTSGLHGIVGNAGEFVGSDSVYVVGDSNLSQCFCSVSGDGIQTNWWKQSSLDQEQIDQLVKDGWIFIPSGLPWGLDDAPYLAKNAGFSCAPEHHNDGGGGGGGGGSAPVCDSSKPPTPQLLSVVRNGSTAKLTWSPVTPVSYYSIVYGTTPGNFIYGVANVGNTTSFTIGSLNPDTTYYFAVNAVNNCMPSDRSGNTGGQVLGASTFAGTGNIITIYSLLILAFTSLIVGLYLHSREI